VLFASAGQDALPPVQVSAGSQAPAEPLQTVDADAKPSTGQVSLTPSQFSATSHAPAEPRHCVVSFASAGQLALEPVQFSAASHTPAEPRQVTFDAWKVSIGQVFVEPSQFSATSHTPAEARHVTALDATPSTGHTPPVQVSATSHAPVAERQRVPSAWFVYVQVPPPQPVAGSDWQAGGLLHAWLQQMPPARQTPPTQSSPMVHPVAPFASR